MAFLLLLLSLSAVDGVLAVAGGHAIASIPAVSGIPIWLVFLHSVQYNVHCTMEHIKGYWTIGLWLSNYYFFCCHTTGLLNIGLASSTV